MDLDIFNKIISLDFFLDAAISFLKKNHNEFQKSRMMRIETFNLIQETLEKYTGKAALLLLSKLGELNAEIIIKDKKMDGKTSKIVNDAADFIMKRKWIKIKKKEFFKESITLEAEWTFQSKSHSNSKYPVCSFIEGFLKKIASSSNEKKEFLCKETKCIARGDNCCEFKIKQK